MKASIPENLKGKALYKFLIENKAALIQEKKSIIKRTDPLVYNSSILTTTKATAKKEAAGDDPTFIPDADTIRVKVVANTCNWIDSQLDMLIADCAKKSIKDRKGIIPHLHDHYQCIEGKVGEVVSIYTQGMKLKDLGVNNSGTTQAIIFETDIMKSYNPAVYNQYRLNKISQHSIGLQYVNISLCINDEESEKEFDFWNKYYPQVINQDMADEYGFFWVVTEIKLLENSCVLFGANELTPTLENNMGSKYSTADQPLKNTGEQPPQNELSPANKSMVVCPSCNLFFYAPDEGTINCTNCGQYVSRQSNSMELSTFDLSKAINETIFVT